MLKIILLLKISLFCTFINAQIYNESFANPDTKLDSIIWSFPFDTTSRNSIVVLNKLVESRVNTNSRTESITIVDSIDLNKDGVKEYFLLRTKQIRTSPSIVDQFCVGCRDRTITRYEVWDVKSLQMIHGITNSDMTIITVSTNVISSTGSEFQLEIKKNGEFIISKVNPENETVKNGIYVFDLKTGQYVSK